MEIKTTEQTINGGQWQYHYREGWNYFDKIEAGLRAAETIEWGKA